MNNYHSKKAIVKLSNRAENIYFNIRERKYNCHKVSKCITFSQNWNVSKSFTFFLASFDTKFARMCVYVRANACVRVSMSLYTQVLINYHNRDQLEYFSECMDRFPPCNTVLPKSLPASL